MDLNLSVIIDGFSGYKLIVHKINDKMAQIRGFQHYSAEFTETEPGFLYVVNAKKIDKGFGENCPKHIIISGNLPKNLPEKAETLIQIQKNIPAGEIVQAGNKLLASYEEWYNSLLMAVINHKPIDAFLDIAAQKFANPMLVMNNNLSIICTAGSISTPVKGTIWEKVNAPGFVLDNFYTPEEIRKISQHIAQKSGQIISLNPANDPAHFTMGINIWIDGKLYGAIGTVDMNKPITEGQKEVFIIISGVLNLYFQNHSVYMRIAEDKAGWVDSLLDGVEIPQAIVKNYLSRFKWKIDDSFCVVIFTASADMKIPIISILDLKQINDLFPDALFSVYEEHVVMIIRCMDKQQPCEKNKQQLEQFLKKDASLRCGFSMVFNNFLNLRYYYIQGKFAATQCKPPESGVFCSYEDYQIEHVLQTLSQADDLRCFCHPGILSLWESGKEQEREMVRCLYHYFSGGKSISDTAEALNLHRNTLIYRLGKAAEVLNIDIRRSSLKQDFMFIISCLIVQRL
jgi:hypothetical protein